MLCILEYFEDNFGRDLGGKLEKEFKICQIKHILDTGLKWLLKLFIYQREYNDQVNFTNNILEN